jgi:hypothetical protein
VATSIRSWRERSTNKRINISNAYKNLHAPPHVCIHTHIQLAQEAKEKGIEKVYSQFRTKDDIVKKYGESMVRAD